MSQPVLCTLHPNGHPASSVGVRVGGTGVGVEDAVGVTRMDVGLGVAGARVRVGVGDGIRVGVECVRVGVGGTVALEAGGLEVRGIVSRCREVAENGLNR